MRYHGFILASCIAGTTFLPATAAHAAPITFRFTVEVTALSGNASALFPTLGAGSIITGQYSSDTSITDGVANPTVGAYVHNPAGGPFTTFVDVEGVRLAWSGSRILVTDTSVFDIYLFESGGASSLPLGLTTASFNGQLSGGGGGQLTSTAFPLTAPTASAFGSRSFSLWLGPDTGIDRIRGNVTSIELVTTEPVPEPATLLLLGTGIAAVARRAQRSRLR